MRRIPRIGLFSAALAMGNGGMSTQRNRGEAEEKRVGAEVFELVLGERRYRASETVGLEKVPTVVKELDDVTVLKLQLVENMQRESLTPMEEAMAFRALKRSGPDAGGDRQERRDDGESGEGSDITVPARRDGDRNRYRYR
jgi:hypothetical protein